MTFLHVLLSTLTGSFANAALQGALLALLLALVFRLLPPISAVVRFLTWTAVFALLIVLHFVPHAATAATLQLQAPECVGVWPMLLAALWLSLSGLRLAQLIAGLWHVRQLRRSATPLGETVCTSHGRTAELCTSQQVERPVVIGFARPLVLLPTSLHESLTADELAYILLHEATHLRRADHWINLAQKLALVAFPLDPALLWIERRMCREREFACDEQVVRQTGSPRAYAMCLATLAERSMLSRAASLALGAWQRQSELVQRVERMLDRRRQAATRRGNAIAAWGLSAALLVASAVFARQPQLFAFRVPGPASPAVVAGNTAGSNFVPVNSVARASGQPVYRSQPAVFTVTARPQRHAFAPRFVRTAAHRREPKSQGPRQRARALQPVASFISSSPVFLPVSAYAVATPDGWILITL